MPTPTDSLRTCYACGHDTHGGELKCPLCQGPTRSPGQIRGLGWVLAVVGGILLVGMAAITVWVTNLLLESSRPGATSRFTGGPEMTYFMYAIFGLVLAFGAASLWAGISQIRTGKRNRKLVPVLLGIAAVLYVAGAAVRFLK